MKQIRSCYTKKGFIQKKNEKLLSIKVSGDLHNGRAVTIVKSEKGTLLYKPKSIKNEVFFNSFLNYFNDLSDNVLVFKTIHILDKEEYGWVEFIHKVPLDHKDEAFTYFEEMGQLLAISYILNITDLHFENILSSGKHPVIIDLETMFTIKITNQKNINEAVDRIIEDVGNSVIMTGMLPVGGGNQIFGGDVSGIFGGTFSTEIRELKNPGRDDIHFERKNVRQEYVSHLPYYMETNRKTIEKPNKYLKEIKIGFKNAYKVFLEHKKELLKYIEVNSNEVTVRLLARNTRDYSVLISAAKSPVYSNSRYKIFNKLKQFGESIDPNLVNSEINQITSLSIPYFKSYIHSELLFDMEDNPIINLKNNPYTLFLEKVQRLSMNDMEEQLSIIDFSIISQQQLFTDGENFQKYLFTSNLNSEVEVNEGIDDLVSIITNTAVIATADQSINWKNLGIGNFEEISFEPLDFSTYRGLSGIGMTLLEVYKIKKDSKVKETLDLIYHTLLSWYPSINDFSYYNGKLGVLDYFFNYHKNVLGKGRKFIDKMYDTYLSELLKTDNVFFDDLIGGYAGIIIYFYKNKHLKNRYKNNIIKLGEILLENATSINEQTIAWYPRLKEPQIDYASYAHGNSGIMTALIFLYDLAKEQKYLISFKKAWNIDKEMKTENGWVDKRKENNEYSANWCHGATGIAIARMEWLKLNRENNFFDLKEEKLARSELNLAINSILIEGLNLNNFCLCHGVTSNLLVLSQYVQYFDSSNDDLKRIVSENFRSIAHFGIHDGWICGLGTQYYSYGMLTGISGILYALLKYKVKDYNLGILVPN